MITSSRRAVAPTQRGVEGASLRWRLTSLDRRSVQGRPRPARISYERRNERRLRRIRDAIDWGYVGFVLAVAVTVFGLGRIALGGGL